MLVRILQEPGRSRDFRSALCVAVSVIKVATRDFRNGSQEVGVARSTAEAGEASQRDPVKGRGHQEYRPFGGKDDKYIET